MQIQMGKILNSLSEESLEKATSILKSLAHPMRLSIIRYLEEREELTVTQLHKLLGIEQPTASHHLGILKDKGIVAYKKRGKHSYYYIKEKRLSDIIDCVTQCSP